MKMKRGLALLMALCMLIGMMPMVGVSAEEYPAITLDTEQTVTISEKGETVYFAFTPANTESYTFSSFGESDTYGYLYDSNMSYLTEDDDEGEDRNFSITYDLEAGQTYILGARFYSSHETGDFSVMLKANHTSSTDGEMVKEPSCTEQGSMNCVCDVCGETYTQAIPTVPHTWDANNTCTVCQYAIPALLTDTETTVIISEGDEIASFSYTPAYTHEYEFYAISDSDTYGSVYDMDMNELDCDDDSGDEMNFLICYTLEAGKTYILGAKYLSDEETGTFQVVLKAKHSCSTEGVVTKEPTCTEDGERICICDVCGDEYTEVIPGGHTWGVDEMVCDRCGVEFHEEGTCGDDVTWVLDKTGTLTISGTGQMYDWSSSGAPWYDYQEMIKIVVLEDGVSSIGDYAFYNCSSLNYIIFNGDAPSIHSTAFSGVTATAYYPVDNATWTSDVMQDYGGDITWVAMSDVFVAEGVCGDNLTWNLDNDGVLTISGTGQMSDWSYSDSIPWYDYRKMIKTVVLEAGVGSIGDTAFYECSSLTSIDLPDSVTSIGGWAFGYCSSLTSVDLGNSVTSIGDYAFYKCGSLVNIGLPDSVTSIGDYAFYDCSSLTSVDLGNSVTSIGRHAFRYCRSLTSIDLPDSVTSIGDYAFSSCSSLTSIDLPDSVTSIGSGAFSDCSSLTGIYVAENNQNYSNDSYGVLYNKQKTTLIQAPGAISGSYAIPDSVTSIGDYAFYKCSSLTSVDLGNSVTSIGDHAFYKCGSLVNIGLPDSVTSIGDHAFYECSSLTSVDLGNSVTSIGDSAFGYCRSLTSIDLPDSVTSIGGWAFGYCRSLTSVDLGDSVTSIGGGAFYDCSSLTSIELPDSVTSIGYSAFYSCRSLTSVDLGNSVTSIGDDAFSFCSSLTSIDLPDSVTSIGYEAFSSCSSLTSVDLGNSVTYIGSYAFWGCSSLSEIIFTGDVPEIDYDAFAGVTADAYYPAGNATWTSDVMQNYNGTITWVAMSDAFVAEGVCGDNLTWTLDNDGVLTISGEGAMDDFSTGTAPWNDHRDQICSVVVEEGVTSIGTYAFADCENLAEVMLPDGLEAIGTYAFAMAGLTEISIPSSVDAIGRHALDCPDMTAIHASYDENGGWYYSIDGILHANGELVRVPMAYPEEDLLLDSHSVTEYALSGCRNITSLTISARASRIRANAFADLSAVTSVRFQGDPFEFDANMFSGMECTVEYPASNTLWTDAVKQQYGGTITWKPYGTDLVAEGICGESLTYGLYGYPQDNATWKLTSDGTLTLSGTGVVTHGGFGGNHPWCEIAINDATRITRVVVEEGLTRFGALSFVGCEYITEVTLPSTLTAFDQGAFCGLHRLKTVDLPEGTTVLSDYMFGGCSSLEELEIPASVTTIMENALAECTSLNQIRFCGDAPSIHSTAFSKVTATAYYPADNATWTSDVMQNYGGNITWVAQYEMLDGDGSVVQMGGTPELEVRAAGEISEFEGVTVDGELVDPSNYTVTEGSTIVTFKPEYLKTLEEGDHTIEVHFTGGVAIAEISVEKPAGILGDLDLNGLVNSDDLTLLARHVGGIELVDGQALLNADVNGDGKVNSDDLTKHARYVGGIITDWDQD